MKSSHSAREKKNTNEQKTNHENKKDNKKNERYKLFFYKDQMPLLFNDIEPQQGRGAFRPTNEWFKG